MTRYRRIRHIIDMNHEIMDLGDERAEEEWLLTYPDGADLDDIKDMADDDEDYGWLVEAHEYIMKRYGRKDS